MDDREPGPGLRTYLAVIAVIVALSGTALWLFGGQTSRVLMTVSGTV